MDYNDSVLCEENICSDINHFNATLKDKNGILIFHTNIRSIQNNIQNLQATIESMDKKPDVIICSEAWLSCCIGFVDLPGYKFYTNNSKYNKSDGVVTYVADYLSETTTVEEHGQLKTTCTIIKMKDKNLMKITGLYRCFKYKEEKFIEDLNTLLRANKHFKNHIISGDVNIDINKDSEFSEEYLNDLIQSNYLPRIKTTTRPPNRKNEKGSCIDHVFSKLSYNSKTFKLLQKISDHYIVCIYIDFCNNIAPVEFKTKINFNKLEKLCKLNNWNNIYNLTDVNQATNYLVRTINNFINMSSKKLKIKKTTSPEKAGSQRV